MMVEIRALKKHHLVNPGICIRASIHFLNQALDSRNALAPSRTPAHFLKPKPTNHRSNVEKQLLIKTVSFHFFFRRF